MATSILTTTSSTFATTTSSSFGTTTNSEPPLSSPPQESSTPTFGCSSGLSECGDYCCSPTEACVSDRNDKPVGCCDAGNLLCGTDSCYDPRKEVCCDGGKYCEDGYSCCGDWCCPSGTYCLDNTAGTCQSSGTSLASGPTSGSPVATNTSKFQQGTLPTAGKSSSPVPSFLPQAGLTIGAKAGISVSAALAAIIVAMAAYMILKRKQGRKAAAAAEPAPAYTDALEDDLQAVPVSSKPGQDRLSTAKGGNGGNGGGDGGPMRELDSNTVYELDGRLGRAELGGTLSRAELPASDMATNQNHPRNEHELG